MDMEKKKIFRGRNIKTLLDQFRNRSDFEIEPEKHAHLLHQ